jgi:hypothetical protein
LNYRDADDKKLPVAVKAYLANRKMACTYTAAQQILAQKALDLLDLAFDYIDSYINFRKKFMTLKLRGAQVRDRALSLEVVNILEQKGYDVVETPQGLLVRIHR